MCKYIGHRPIWGRCPAPSLNLNHNLLGQGTGTTDHLTLLRLFPLLFLFLLLLLEISNEISILEITKKENKTDW